MLHGFLMLSPLSLTCRVVMRWLRTQPTETRRLCALKSPERCQVPLLQMSAGSSGASLAFARSSWEAKRKASRARRGETWITYSIFMHLPPPLEHSPTRQNSNNTKQYNTYIPQSTIQKQTSKKNNTEQPTNSNKGKQQTQANKAPLSSTTYLLQLTQQNPYQLFP